MSLRVIYNTIGRYYFTEIARRLAINHDWIPIYWISRPNPVYPNTDTIVKERFPEVIFHDYRSACFGVHPEVAKDVRRYPLDETILRDFSVQENLVLKMMDRIGGIDTFLYGERIRHYHRELSYWMGIVDYFKPDLAVFGDRPHEIFDYILYHVCKYRGVKTIVHESLEYVIPGLWLWYEDPDQGCPEIKQAYHYALRDVHDTVPCVNSAAKSYGAILKGDYSVARPNYMKIHHDRMKKQGFIGQLIWRLQKTPSYRELPYKTIMKIGRLFVRHKNTQLPKKKKKKLEESLYRWDLETVPYQIRTGAFKGKLRRTYERKARPVDLDKQYIFVPLHYQPESSTSPRGGYFVHQILMINMLSDCLPEKWFLYVKEHSTQFAKFLKGERSRSTNLYEDAAALTNVKLVPISYSSFDLIDNSLAVATVTGTAGWEALWRGKPAIVFGRPWYEDCEGVFYAPDNESLRKVVKCIEHGYHVDEKKVLLFLSLLVNMCLGDDRIDLTQKYSHQSYRDYIDKWTEKISEACSNK